jgi:DNA-binding response OmpR family regulator
MHVLVVEDDLKLGRLLRRLLERDQHVVDVATDAAGALELASISEELDAVILDIGLPDGSGLDVARRLRAVGHPVGILMLTARDELPDRVAGLDAGADDYLVKPFAYEELAARLRALGRRPRPIRKGSAGKLVAGPIALDEASHEVSVEGAPVPVTGQEFVVLEALMRQAGRAMTRDELLDRAWPLGTALTPNAVEAYVSRLRAKLGPAGERIETVRGIGYRLRGA